MRITTYHKGGQPSIHQGGGRFREQRMVYVIGHVASERPVVRTVFEQIPQGHRRMGETVHKKCLQKTLSVMSHPACSRNSRGKCESIGGC